MYYSSNDRVCSIVVMIGYMYMQRRLVTRHQMSSHVKKVVLQLIKVLPILPTRASEERTSRMETPPLQKRPRGTPTFLTPVRPSKRGSRARISFPERRKSTKHVNWSNMELLSLVEAVRIYRKTGYSVVDHISCTKHHNSEVFIVAFPTYM